MRLKTSEKRYYGLFDYNPEHIYEIGDIVIYDELAYRCHSDMAREDLGTILPNNLLHFRPLHDLTGEADGMINTFDEYLTSSYSDMRPLNAGILRQVINHYTKLGESLDISSVDLEVITSPGIYRNPKMPLNIVENPVGETCYLRVIEGSDDYIVQELITDEYLAIRTSNSPVINRVVSGWTPWKVIHLNANNVLPVANRINYMINSIVEMANFMNVTTNSIVSKEKGFKVYDRIENVEPNDFITLIYMEGTTQKSITGTRKDITTLPENIKKILVYG